MDNNHHIEVIFIDVGNTLRLIVDDEPYQADARKKIAALLGIVDESPEVFVERLGERYKKYRKWAFDTLREASEEELWTQWLLPERSREEIAFLVGELTFLYRKTMGRRFAHPDARKVVMELSKRGYRLGIISNTITEREIPKWLEEDGLSPYFQTVVLSSLYGYRKPGPEIYLEATRRAGVAPAQAAYVADNPIRDVQGSREAGFGMVIILSDPDNPDRKPPSEDFAPDVIIEKLSDLLEIFPPR